MEEPMATAMPDPVTRAETPLLIAFADLTRYAAQSMVVSDEELAKVMDSHYERVAAGAEAAGGRVVKFIGDAALLVFPATRVDDGVDALLQLKAEVDQAFAALGWECRMTVKVHFGTAIAGPYGAARSKRFDVLGKAVNAAAMLDSTGVALSAEAFRKLSPAMRKRFKKHTWPVTYIRTEDTRRFRRR
jgi:adenylate cyclase